MVRIGVLLGGVILVLTGIIGLIGYHIQEANLQASICGNMATFDVTPYIGDCLLHCVYIASGALVLALSLRYCTLVHAVRKLCCVTSNGGF